MSYAAAVLLFPALAISAYRVGIRRGVEVATRVPATQGKGSDSLEEQLGDLSHERETLRAQLAARDTAIDDLRQQAERLKAVESDRVGNSVSVANEQESCLVEEAASANARMAELQKKLDGEEKTRTAESSRAGALEAKLGELTQQLHERNETIAVQTRRLESRDGTIEQQEAKAAEQQELLDHDRDIRELMGAGTSVLPRFVTLQKTEKPRNPMGGFFSRKVSP